MAPLEDDGPPDDDTQRRRVADRLAGLVELNVDLACVCEALASVPKKGRVEGIYAAARLTQANAQLGRSIAQLLQVEQRRKTIVERVQAPAPQIQHSNVSEEDRLLMATQSKMIQYMQALADEIFDPAMEDIADYAAVRARVAAKEAAAKAAANGEPDPSSEDGDAWESNEDGEP